MESERRDEWIFSLFAGLFAPIFYFTVRALFTDDSIDRAAWPFMIAVFAAAAIAARLGSYLARWRGRSGYGLTAGFFTWPIYTVFVYGLVLAQHYRDSGSFGSDLTLSAFSSYALVATLFILPACMMGTVFFLIIHHLWLERWD